MCVMRACSCASSAARLIHYSARYRNGISCACLAPACVCVCACALIENILPFLTGFARCTTRQTLIIVIVMIIRHIRKGLHNLAYTGKLCMFLCVCVCVCLCKVDIIKHKATQHRREYELGLCLGTLVDILGGLVCDTLTRHQ